MAVGEKPQTYASLTRVLKASKYIKLDDDGHLYIIGEPHDYRRIIPMKDRIPIVKEVAKSMAYPHGDRVY